MAKGQKKSNREAKKPKQTKKPSPIIIPSFTPPVRKK
jgi:hypothetical protein